MHELKNVTEGKQVELYLLGCFFFVKMDHRTLIVVKVSCSRIRFDDHCLKSISDNALTKLA
jgi:hypothetical protein